MGEHLRSGRQMDKTLRDLSLRKEAPKSGFILLVFVYLIATVGTIFVSRNGGRLVGIAAGPGPHLKERSPVFFRIEGNREGVVCF